MSKENRPVMIVAGTRPEAIKLAPVVWWLDRLGVDYVFVWSGQHYDYELSRVFFEQLGLPEPALDLDVRSGSHAEQTARIVVGVESAVKRFNPFIVVAQGDTNTVLAAALASAKMFVPFAHVEAGLRSWDRTMPEEINRIVADAVAELNFAPTYLAAINLMHSGTPFRKIFVTGNTIVDVVYRYETMASEEGEKVMKELGIEPEKFILVTVHRQENTGTEWRLRNIVKILKELSKHMPIVFPAHPRTVNRLQQYSLLDDLRNHVILTKPLGYFQFLGLLKNASAVLTDSGGVQEEACILGVPTITLRYNTERPETVLAGTNIVAGVEPEKVIPIALNMVEYRGEIAKKKGCKNFIGDGAAGEKIARILKESKDKIAVETYDTREDPYIIHVLIDASETPTKGEIIAMYDEYGIPTTDANIAKKIVYRIAGSFYLSRRAISKGEGIRK
jgi:UDP-N-acetylglucosamine 2-epimerase (non-hydrolysing)